MITCENSVRVRYSETDKMGIVHHSQYLNWLECARIELLDQIEMPYKQLEASGCFMPVLSLQIQYRRPAKFDDRITTRVSLSAVPSARIKIDYEILSVEELLATATSCHAFTCTKGHAIRPPKELLAAIRKHWTV